MICYVKSFSHLVILCEEKGEAPLSLNSQPNWQPRGGQHFRYLVLPLVGFLVIAFVWIGMDKLALMLGTIWLILGIAFLFFRTKGFKKLSPHLDV